MKDRLRELSHDRLIALNECANLLKLLAEAKVPHCESVAAIVSSRLTALVDRAQEPRPITRAELQVIYASASALEHAWRETITQ